MLPPDGELMRPEMPMTELPIGIALPAQIAHEPRGFHVRRLMQVIEQRRGADEALVADQLLGIQGAVGPPEHDVPLARERSELVVDRHVLDHFNDDCRLTIADWPQCRPIGRVRLVIVNAGSPNQRFPERLLALDRFEQRLEVALAEAAAALPLDDLEEHRRPILDRRVKICSR